MSSFVRQGRRIEDLEDLLGKSTPFCVMGAFDKLAKLAKGSPEVCHWALDNLFDFLTVGLYNYQELKGVYFYGKTSAREKCLLDVIVLKKTLLDYFLKDGAADCNISAEDLSVLKSICASHAEFRKKCGGGNVKVDISWQGTRGEAFCASVSFLASVIFGCEHDGAIKQAIKSSTQPEAVFGQSPFKEILEQIQSCTAKVMKINTEPGLSANMAPEADMLRSFLTTEQLQKMKEEEADSLRTWADAALQHVARYVKLFVEPTTHLLLAEVLSSTVMAEGPGTHNSHSVVYYDVKTAGESSSHAHVRPPSFKQERLRKVVQGYLIARGVEAGCVFHFNLCSISV